MPARGSSGAGDWILVTGPVSLWPGCPGWPGLWSRLLWPGHRQRGGLSL